LNHEHAKESQTSRQKNPLTIVAPVAAFLFVLCGYRLSGLANRCYRSILKMKFIFLKLIFAPECPWIAERIPGRPNHQSTPKVRLKAFPTPTAGIPGSVGEVFLRTSTAWKHLHKNINKLSY
jgi:hypothetical protein